MFQLNVLASLNYSSHKLCLGYHQAPSYFLEQYRDLQPDIVKKLCKLFYVDNLVTGAGDEEQADKLFTNAKAMLKEGGFNLRKFHSNSVTLQLK